MIPGKNLRGRNIRERMLRHDSIHFPLPAHKDIFEKLSNRGTKIFRHKHYVIIAVDAIYSHKPF
jgi:hypothetical protein